VILIEFEIEKKKTAPPFVALKPTKALSMIDKQAPTRLIRDELPATMALQSAIAMTGKRTSMKW
jgi:hypothetical protein